jgi:hypothetical protein
MTQRNISMSAIEFALDNFDMTLPGNDNSTELHSKPFPDGRVLKVWFMGHPPPRPGVIIKSTAWKD